MNIATVGDVKIDLEEPGYPGNDSEEVAAILPNQEIVKDPQVETAILPVLLFPLFTLFTTFS